MMDNTIKKAIGLLEECVINGSTGPQALCYWFNTERTLIERTIQELYEEQNMKELADDLGEQEYLNNPLIA